MKLIPIFLPEAYNEIIEHLIKQGRYSSRSAVIRHAIRELLRRELQQMNEGSSKLLPEKMKFFKEIFLQLLDSQTYSLELNEELIEEECNIELKLNQDLGIWIFSYNNIETTVFLLHTECATCPHICPQIKNKDFDKICLVKTNSLPATEDLSEQDVEFIAKVFYVIENQFPPNKENQLKKIPPCKRDHKNLS